MKVSTRRRVAQTDLEVTVLGLGAAPIGNYNGAIDDDAAAKISAAAWAHGIRYIDTAPLYGHGLSEHRVGESLRGADRADFVVSTKVGRLLRPTPRESVDFGPYEHGLPFALEFDYGYDGVMRSFEDSLQRLGLSSIDIVLVHDVDVVCHGASAQRGYFEDTMAGGYRALDELRSQGVVQAIGLGVNEHEVALEALRRHDFNCFLLAGRYSLLEHDALAEFLPLCQERGASVVVGGAFNSGILATGAVSGARYNYAPATPWAMTQTASISAVCAEHDVSLPAAALQFVLAHPAVVSVAVGCRSVEQLDGTVSAVEAPIPTAFWQRLHELALLPEAAPTPLAG